MKRENLLFVMKDVDGELFTHSLGESNTLDDVTWGVSAWVILDEIYNIVVRNGDIKVEFNSDRTFCLVDRKTLIDTKTHRRGSVVDGVVSLKANKSYASEEVLVDFNSFSEAEISKADNLWIFWVDDQWDDFCHMNLTDRELDCEWEDCDNFLIMDKDDFNVLFTQGGIKVEFNSDRTFCLVDRRRLIDLESRLAFDVFDGVGYIHYSEDGEGITEEIPLSEVGF